MRAGDVKAAGRLVRSRLVVGLALGAALLAGCGSSTKHPSARARPSAHAAAAASGAPSPEQSCINEWNSSGWPVQTMQRNAQGWTLFAQVGTYDGVAGSCAVTAVMPDYNGGTYSNVPGLISTDVATFFYTCPEGWCQGQSSLVPSLPAGSTDWNAHMSSSGLLAAGVPQAVTHQQTTTTTSTPSSMPSAPSAPGSCHLVKVSSGTVSCATALKAANAAIADPNAGPNNTVKEDGFGCYVYPYEVDCSGSAGAFSTLYGTTGTQ